VKVKHITSSNQTASGYGERLRKKALFLSGDRISTFFVASRGNGTLPKQLKPHPSLRNTHIHDYRNWYGEKKKHGKLKTQISFFENIYERLDKANR
jgi:hypothetical protein